MKEQVYKLSIANARIEVILLDAAFYMRCSESVGDVMSHIRHIHRHSTHEIFFVLDGTLSLFGEDGSFVYENSAVIVPPGYNHYTVSNVKKGYCFYFTVERSGRTGDDLFARMESRLAGGITSFALDEESKFYVSQLANSVDGSNRGETIGHVLFLLFFGLLEKMDTPQEIAKNDTAKSNKYIHRIDAYISSKQGNVTLGDLAQELYLSPKQVSRIVQKEYGCTFPEFVNQRRLTSACMLLKYTDLSVSQIASTVGYTYENYFFALFKRTYGVTPLQYRKQNVSDEMR